MLKWPILALAGAAALVSGATLARGVSPYLPLDLEPQMEREIERVLILAGKPVMTRPIAAATVLEALPKACKVDAVLCSQVRRYLDRFMHKYGVTTAGVEGASSSGAGASSIAPDRYGMSQGGRRDASAQVYMQPNDNLLLDLGAVAYEGRTSWTGSMVSMGWENLQLDVGFRPHWLSPMSDSSTLMSTESPTMPSWTISNYEPLTSLGITYQIFEAKMSKSDNIVWQDGFTSGSPQLGGAKFAMEPANGSSLSLNRLAQFGGGARGNGSLRTHWHWGFSSAPRATGWQRRPTASTTASGSSGAMSCRTWMSA
jgi:Capsule assembly protein Wzi